MRGLAAARRVAACFCMVLVPVLTLAQPGVNPPGGYAAPGHADDANSDNGSSSAVAAAVLELPDAPVPQNQTQTQQPAQQTPAPNQTPQQQPQSGNAPTLGDLGFTPQETLANAEMQKRLNERTHDLKVHQMLGLITAVPLCATVIVADGAKDKRNKATGVITGPSSTAVDLHAALGAGSAALYGFTAYYAIIAPKVPGVKPKGAIKWHRDLVWIHGPGMILTPILGGMALSQENNGERVHGIASAHSYVAWTTVAAYGASIVAVTWPIHLKFWEK